MNLLCNKSFKTSKNHERENFWFIAFWYYYYIYRRINKNGISYNHATYKLKEKPIFWINCFVRFTSFKSSSFQNSDFRPTRAYVYRYTPKWKWKKNLAASSSLIFALKFPLLYQFIPSMKPAGNFYRM